MKSTIAIKCMRELGVITVEQVEAEVFGNWAVHKTARPGTGYSVTYIPMGCCVGFATGFSKSACVRAARALNACDLKTKATTEPELTRWFIKHGAALSKIAWGAIRGDA